MAAPHDIVGYTFRADTYCSACVTLALPTGEDEPFDGWALVPGTHEYEAVTLGDRQATESNLSEIATAFGIDRDDETTFDSGDFPKVVFRDSASDYAHTHDGQPERCGMCGEPLTEPDDLDDGPHFAPDI